MCEIYAGQDPHRFASTTRSLRLAGHATSIRLENAFWGTLDRMARDEGRSTPDLIATLYDEVVARSGPPANFTSLLRTTCLLHAQRGMDMAAIAAE